MATRILLSRIMILPVYSLWKVLNVTIYPYRLSLVDSWTWSKKSLNPMARPMDQYQPLGSPQCICRKYILCCIPSICIFYCNTLKTTVKMKFLHFSHAFNLFLILLRLSTSFAEELDNLNPAGVGCVDPQGYLDCYAEQSNQLTDCMKVANETCVSAGNYQTCALGCGGAYHASKIGCWLQSCWNQVGDNRSLPSIVR